MYSRARDAGRFRLAKRRLSYFGGLHTFGWRGNAASHPVFRTSVSPAAAAAATAAATAAAARPGRKPRASARARRKGEGPGDGEDVRDSNCLPRYDVVCRIAAATSYLHPATNGDRAAGGALSPTERHQQPHTLRASCCPNRRSAAPAMVPGNNIGGEVLVVPGAYMHIDGVGDVMVPENSSWRQRLVLQPWINSANRCHQISGFSFLGPEHISKK